ncbi:MAG: hypothetical protein GX369_05275 [Euryarchaeota archaeon]|nr:hypothetical protein [Euryarchaeota archaeon]
MNVILARYAEVGLKSPGVRRHFESILINNIELALARQKIEALVSCEAGRIYVRTDRIDDAVTALSYVFGIASISPAIECTSSMEDMQHVAAEMSKYVLTEGSSFAVRARREGTHPYTSMDIGREVGSAVFLANEDQEIRVDLTNPDFIIYVEVRGKKAFIFSHYVSGPGGLPLGSQGKVVASINKERDSLAAWMMMKRGCRVLVCGEERPNILEAWDPNLKRLDNTSIHEAVSESKALGVVFGYSMDDINFTHSYEFNVPSYYPLIGMTNQEVIERLKSIKQ